MAVRFSSVTRRRNHCSRRSSLALLSVSRFRKTFAALPSAIKTWSEIVLPRMMSFIRWWEIRAASANCLSPNSFFPVMITEISFALPGLIITPMAVTEFVLAEIFQNQWPEHIGYDTPHLQRWAPIQRKRLNKLLDWNVSLLQEGGSPWTTIKQRKPDVGLFL